MDMQRSLAGPWSDLSREEALLLGASGDGEFAYGVGRVLGLPVALFLLMGRAFYENGGLTGSNPWLRKR